MQKLDAKLQYFGHLIVKSWLIGKDPNTGKDWGQEENGGNKGWDSRMASSINGHEFEQTPGDSEGQESLVSCSP